MDSPRNAEEFTASLERRARAAKGLERDLVTEVPLLYGRPGRLEPEGDPGIVLARIHREELQRRNSGGLPLPPGARSESPSKRARTAISVGAILFLLIFLFG